MRIFVVKLKIHLLNKINVRNKHLKKIKCRSKGKGTNFYSISLLRKYFHYKVLQFNKKSDSKPTL